MEKTKILDICIKSSSFYRNEVESKLDQRNAVEGHISDRDTSVNPDSYIEDQTTFANASNDKSVLQESRNVNAESYIEDASNDLSENIDNTVLDGCDTKRNVDMSVEKTKQDDFQQAENTFVPDSPLLNHSQENVSEVKTTVVPETDEENEINQIIQV